MKRFLEELAKSQAHLTDSVPVRTDAQRKKAELREVYNKLIGKRALHIPRGDRELNRIVKIKSTHPHYVRVTYKYYGMDYEGELSMCITYLSLLCGEDRLDVE